MKRIRQIYGFTLLETLTALAIIAVLIGLLIPAISMIQKSARNVKQKSQFHGIEVALEAFRTDVGDYPPSSYTLNNNPNPNVRGADGYCGAQKLAEALVGMDGFGYHPKSQWRADGLADMDNDGNINNPVYHAGVDMPYETAAENLRARKGPYLELENANAVKLADLYPSGSDIFGALAGNTFVLCDMFGQVKNAATGKKTGMPILYFKADTNNTFYRPSTLGTFPWAPDTTQDGIYNVNQNFPFYIYVANGISMGMFHPLYNTRMLFYNRIKNPNFPGAIPPDYLDARPYRSQTFILLSAGADAMYGTADDVYNIDEGEK